MKNFKLEVKIILHTYYKIKIKILLLFNKNVLFSTNAILSIQSLQLKS